MAWDDKTPALVTQARLLNLPPATVYEELKQYAAYQAESSFRQDNKLEEALLPRNDPLICLGLAQYGTSDKVAAVLYKLMPWAAHELEPARVRVLRLAAIN